MPEDSYIQPFDPLSLILNGLGLRADVFARVEASGSWGIAIPGKAPYFHVLLSGQVWVSRAGGEALKLVPGDLVFLQPGGGHVLSGRLGDDALPLDQWMRCCWQPERALLKLGTEPPETIAICGSYHVDSVGYGDALAALPDLLVVRHGNPTGFDALECVITLLAHESFSRSPGSALTCARLVEMLLVFGIRHWLRETTGLSASWWRGLQDPCIAQALKLIYADPAQKWEVEVLARSVGLSRSAFAARFKTLVGESPARHIVRWRMNAARKVLASGMKVIDVATQFGYESESAFSRAFSRWIGQPPAAFKSSNTQKELSSR